MYIADSINDSFAKVSRKSVEYSDSDTSISPYKKYHVYKNYEYGINN